MTDKFNTFVVVICTVVFFMLVAEHCNMNKERLHFTHELNSLMNERVDLLDSIAALEMERVTLKAQKEKVITKYIQLPAKERVKLIHVIDSNATLTDSSATLTMAGIDSINKLQIHYKYLQIDLAKCDSISALKSNVISSDSVIVHSQQTLMREQKKAAKTVLIRAAVLSSLVGVIIGLML